MKQMKRLLCIVLIVVLSSSTALAYNPGGGGPYSGPGSSTNNRGTNLGRGYRIGIGYVETATLDVSSESNYRDTLEKYISKNYVPIDSPKDAVYVQVVTSDASKDNSSTKIANSSSGQPTTTKPKAFRKVNRNAETRNTQNVVYRALKAKGLNTDDYFTDTDVMDAKSIIARLKKSGVTIPTKEQALSDIENLLATDTKISTSSRRWIVQVKEDGTAMPSMDQAWGQLTAMLTLYIALGNQSSINTAFKETMKVYKNSESAFNSKSDFPVITIEAIEAFNDGSSVWWCSIPEAMAYAFKIPTYEFFITNSIKNKSMLDTIEREIKDVSPNAQKKLDTFTWPATFTLYMFDKGYEYNNGNPKLENITTKMGREWMTAITAISGTELYGYQVISDVYTLPIKNIKGGQFSWELSETGSHNVTKEARIKGSGKFNTNLSITNFNLAQTEKKYKEYISYLDYNKPKNIELQIQISRIDSSKAIKVSKDKYNDLFKQGTLFGKATSHLTASKTDVKSYSKIDGNYVESSSPYKISLTDKQLRYMLNPDTQYNRKLKMITDKVNIDFNKTTREYFIYTVSATLILDKEEIELKSTNASQKVDYSATPQQDKSGNVNVNYYYDDELGETVAMDAKLDDVITKYDTKPKAGFTWSYTEPSGTPNTDGNTNLTVTAGDNIIDVYYYSKPKTYEYNSEASQPYAEIKSGYVTDSGSTEQYEAMAGFPTTEDLYFASGGDEFLVQLKYEYTSNAESIRTYTRKSTESRSALYIPYSTQTGPQDTASSGSAPADLKSSDSAGNTATTKWFAFRTGETKWNWSATASTTVPSHKTKDAVPAVYDKDGKLVTAAQPAEYCGGASDSKTTTKSNSATPGEAAVAKATCPCGISTTATVQQSKVAATAWNWAWHNYGHANEYTSSDSESLPYTSNNTFSNSRVETKVPTDNGKYFNITTTVNNASESVVMKNISKTGVMSHIISWDQPITDFNYAKITDAKVWKLSKSKLTGTVTMTETDEIFAEVQQTDDAYLSNIAEKDTARDGRLWHSLKSTDQDEYMFPTYNSSGQSEASVEYDAGKSLKDLSISTMYNDTYAISDYLILRTSTGDLSMVYFDYNADNKTVPIGTVTVSGTAKGGSYSIKANKVSFKSQSAKATEAIICAGTKTFQGISLPETLITYGGYNGNYSTPSTKFTSKSGFNTNIDLSTIKIADSTYSKFKSTQKPSPTFKLVNTFDVNDKNVENGLYEFESSEVFYQNIINYGSDDPIFDIELIDDYGNNGFTIDTTYSPRHGSINSVIVHNPTSSQYATLIPLDSSRDQRTTSSLIEDKTKNNFTGACTGNSSTCEYAHLECTYNGFEFHTDDCYDYEEVEYITNSGEGKQSTVYDYTGSVQKITLDPGTYLLEAFGAQGGSVYKDNNSTNNLNAGGKGGYSAGTITISVPTVYYLYVGGQGQGPNDKNPGVGGFNGGGSSNTGYGYSPYSKKYDGYELTGGGGGATDIRSITDSLNTRILVAGGGGGADMNDNWASADSYGGTAGAGGGLEGLSAVCGKYPQAGIPGTQTSGNAKGIGSNGLSHTDGRVYSAASGGGYYGGKTTLAEGPGSGGSGYVSSTLNNGISLNGEQQFTNSYYSNEIGHSGNGAIVISKLGEKVTAIEKYTTRTLICEEPHHSANTNWTYYTDGWITDDGVIYKGTGKANIKPIEGAEYFNTETIINDLVLIKTENTYKLAKKSSPYTDLITGKSITLDTYTTDGIVYKDCIWSLTNTNAASIHTKDATASQYHYTFGDDTCWDPCNNDDNHKNSKPVSVDGTTYTKSGEFVNLDYGFQIYFPNIGNFYGNGAYGIGEISNTTGKGYTSPMNTTEWLKNKYVSFGFPVIYDKDGDGDFSDDKLYLSNEPIPLGDYSSGTFIDDSTDRSYIYNFYVPLADLEEYSASVEFYTVAINSTEDEWSENPNSHNFVRSDYRAPHDSKKTTAVDVVGRIGGLTMQDSGDFRFANLFKLPTNGWLVNNIVKNVDVSKQNFYLADPYNVRGILASESTNGLNTYGTQTYKNDLSKLIEFPLVPNKNNIDSLKKQPQRIGYMNYLSLETLGNYYGENQQGDDTYKTQITPYYYALDLSTGTWTPVDVYMTVGTTYKRINQFDNKEATAEYEWFYSLNWEEESKRRQYTSKEKAATDAVVDTYTTKKGLDDGTDLVGKLLVPSGKDYLYGTAQRIFMKDKNRTFYGTELTESVNTNPNGTLNYTDENGNSNSSVYYSRQGQRWNFTLGLPSSAVFVPTGEACTTANIDKLANNHTVIVCALEILARGEVWTLKYNGTDVSEQNIQVLPDGPIYNYVDNPDGPGDKPIVTVYSINKSSKQDLDTEGTH